MDNSLALSKMYTDTKFHIMLHQEKDEDEKEEDKDKEENEEEKKLYILLPTLYSLLRCLRYLF